VDINGPFDFACAQLLPFVAGSGYCLSVKGIPGTLQDSGAVFATTHWSVVAACAYGSEMADAALARLCRDYWPPLYSFVRRRGYSSADAQDLVQGFFAYLLQSKAYAQTNRRKGKFRSFLLASLKHYIADVWDRERALKRGGNYEFVLLDEKINAVETLCARESRCVGMTLDEEQQYEQSWAAALVARALGRIEAEFGNEHKTRLFGALKPFLTGGVGLPSQEKVARRLDMPVETLRSHLSRLRARYRELLREEVARTIGVAEDVDEELHHLCRILTANC
jgi:RNA polymerase sigma-70 factor (ECF subfamily)